MDNLINNIIASVKADLLLKDYLSNNSFSPNKKLVVISIGKASIEMHKAFEELYAESIISSLIISPYDYKNTDKATYIKTSHPFPDQNSLFAGKELIKFIKKYADEFIVFLISGGGSALIEKLSGISLQNYNYIIKTLMDKDCNINEINTVRKHLSEIKGGRILRYLFIKRLRCSRIKIISIKNKYFINSKHYAHFLKNAKTFILSDIFTGEVDNVSSGLSFKDITTLDDAIKILEKNNLSSFCKYLKITPKKYRSIDFDVIADNMTLLEKCSDFLIKNNIKTIISNYKLSGKASICGLNIGCQIYKFYNKSSEPIAIIYGGECTVELRNNGLGGRVQEITLAIAIEIQGLQNIEVIAIASDGKDGNSEAMGAVINGDTCKKIKESGQSPEKFLRNNDTYSALKIGAKIINSQYTGTNLNDVIIVLIGQTNKV